MSFFRCVGDFFIFMSSMWTGPISKRILISTFVNECFEIGIRSCSFLWLITCFISIIVCYNFFSLSNVPFVSKTMISLSIKNVVFLEVAPTLPALVFIGQCCLGITNSIFNMKTTGQLDAISVVGLNKYKFHAMPKIIAVTMMYPLMAITACLLSLLVCFIIPILFFDAKAESILDGFMDKHNHWYMNVFLLKTFIYGFLMSSVSTFVGFYSDELTDIETVSKRSFKACCCIVLFADILITYYIYI